MNLSFTLIRDRQLHLIEYHWSANLLNSIGTVLALLITLPLHIRPRPLSGSQARRLV